MTMLADAFMGKDSIAIRETIGNEVMNVLPEAGRWFDDMDVIDIGRADGFEVGRDGLIKKRFMGSISGTVRGGQNFNGHRAIYGDKTTALGSAAPFYLSALQTAGPNPLLSPIPAPWGLTMELYSAESTVLLTQAQLQLQMIPAVIKDQISPIFRGMAKNLAHYVSVHFFTDREQGSRLATLGASGTGATEWAYDNTTGVKTLSFYPLERTIMRFIPGQEVDLWDLSGDVRINEVGGVRIPMWVASVSHAKHRVVVAIDPNQDLTAAPWTTLKTDGTLTTGDYIVWADQKGGSGLKAPYGWHDWIKSGGTDSVTGDHTRLLGTAAITTTANDYIDVNQKPAFQSWEQNSIGTLTQQDLELRLDEAVLAAQAYGNTYDTILFSRGVRHAMWQLDLARSYLTNNRPGSQEDYGLGGGFAVTTPSGGKLRGYVASMLEDGEVLALKLKGNWKITTLPQVQGGSTNSQLSPNEGPAKSIPITFKGKLFGFPTDKVPIYNSSAENLDGVHFPAQMIYNFVPSQQVPGFRLTGVTTVRSFSAPA